jgi:branched-chain amino acid transport system substrate-binding protein
MKIRTIERAFVTRLLLAVGASVLIAGPSAAAETQVKIGFASPLTGSEASYGKDDQNGAQLALDEANAANIKIGGKQVKFVLDSQDDQADPRNAVQVAQRLVDDKVAVVIGHLNSGTTIPASRIYNAAGIPMITPSATNPTITSQGYDNIFSIIATDAQNAGNACKYAVEVMKAKRIGIIDDRTAFGQGETDEFDKAVKAAGGAIVDREFTSDKATDFHSQVTNLKAANVDLVFFGGLDALAANFVKQMRQLGLKATFVAGGGVKDEEFIKIAGSDAEGATAWEYGRPLESSPSGKNLEEKFKQTFNVFPLAYGQYFYDATWLAIRVMQDADSVDPKVYLPKLKNIAFQGATGQIAFNKSGSLKGGSSTLYQVKNGAWVVIETKDGT